MFNRLRLFLMASAMLAVSGFVASAGTMTLTTDLPVGEKVRILLNSTSATTPVSIDWGNGVPVNYTVDPSQMAYNRWIDGTIEGTTLVIKGNVTEATIEELGLTSVLIEYMSNLTSLTLSNNRIEEFELVGVTPLKSLNLSYNNIYNSPSYNPTLSLENAAETLTDLSIYHNPGLGCLNISALTNLVYLSANDCPDLGSVFICLPEESRPNLRSINLSNCDLAHFYPVSLPSLTTLNLNNNSLSSSIYDTSPFVLGDYPSLTTLSVSDNRAVQELDITACKKLESLSISNCGFKSIDLSQAPNLTTLSAANNNISSLDLGNNPDIRTINIAGNPIRELDLSKFGNLQSVDISNTQISRVMLMNAFYLTSFIAQNTNIEFIDFNGQQASRMTKIDIRDNKKMTGATMTYTLRTLPECKTQGNQSQPNLLISGSNGETAYTAIAEDIDHHWTIDVDGDGTALNVETAVTVDATDTGENKTGRLDRLYPHFGMGLDYDLDIYETDGGRFLIAQWKPVWFQSIQSVTDKAYVGVPIHIYPYPEEGKKFKSVTVNGVEIADRWFVVSGPSTIKVNFTAEESAISFTTTPGQNLSMLVNTVSSNGTVWVDWGTGNRTEYTGQNSYNADYAQIFGTRIEGSAAGPKVTLYGEISALDLSGYGDVAEWFGLWDNAITSIDLSAADNLQYLNMYWNPLESIDLSGAPNLVVLDVSYTNLKTLDLSGATGLKWLDAYSDGYGDDGISMLTSIDVTGLPLLQHLDVHSNDLTALDLSKNPYLWYLKASGNRLESIDLSHNTALEYVLLQDNRLTDLDVTMLSKLDDLTVSKNELTSLDVSKNSMLSTLYIDNNRIKTIDTSALTNLKVLYLNGNGMSADDLNDTYYMLPQRKIFNDNEETSLGYNIAVIQGGDREENEGTRADSSIAEDRGWTPSHKGSNGGSDFAYLDIRPTAHGSATVTDADGNVYTSGSKVPKYVDLTIVPVADEGYEMSSFTLNAEEPMTGVSFTMPGIYTKLAVTFAKRSGVTDATSGVGVFAEGNTLFVNADSATVDVFGVDGVQTVASAPVAGSWSTELPQGVYIVRLTTPGGNVTTRKVAVR